MRIDDIPAEALSGFRRGGVIPAHPLALDATRALDERRQRALTRYYLDAGVVGLAVGVHTTQFAIRDRGLLRPVLELATGEARGWSAKCPLLIAGAVGSTNQAVAEAQLAADLGYHAVLLSLAGRKGGVDELIAHCRRVTEVMPVVGFYLQPAAGGRVLPYEFWRAFSELDNVLGIKIAPFNRYRTLDVIRGVIDAKAEGRLALYTGNDDHIVADLLTPFEIRRDDALIRVRIVGGLLGHWAVWTRRAVELVERIRALDEGAAIGPEWLTLDVATTDCNAAFFDAENDYAGCIAGLHEVLRRQGLFEGIWCLDEAEGLGPGQADAINRVCRDYPDLNDDDFVRANLDRWFCT